MRKQDYVHFHALLVVLSRFLRDRNDLSAERLGGYESLGTRPTDIHASKRSHRRAVLELADATAGGVQESGPARSGELETPRSTDD